MAVVVNIMVLMVPWHSRLPVRAMLLSLLLSLWC